ncbi:MAG TPA: hypothetical protein VHC91_09555 [Trinickia sp.]|nr:hypothetical protein [Trinickia sp.]HVW50629.1 hypothetical protein [Trinickia sp.]
MDESKVIESTVFRRKANLRIVERIATAHPYHGRHGYAAADGSIERGN